MVVVDGDKRQWALAAYRSFLTTPLERLLPGAGDDGREDAVRLFHDVAARVPAYRHFLREHGIDHASIETAHDFAGVPLTTKDDYLRRHPLADLCWEGRVEGYDMLAASSGSTGEPTFWPRFLTDAGGGNAVRTGLQ
jgi:phenylacetate-CoA ligase